MYLFDMDGTLIDSNGVWKDVDREFLARRGLPYTRAYYEGVAHTIFPLAAKFTKEFCHLPESEEAIMAEWMELAKDAYAHVTVKPGVRAFLKQCRMENRRMALVTSSVPVHCRTAMEKLGLMKYFESVTFAQELGLEKKDKQLWLTVARQLGVEPESCTLFDDSLAACRDGGLFQCQRIPAGAAVVIVAAVLTVHRVPCVGQGNGLTHNSGGDAGVLLGKMPVALIQQDGLAHGKNSFIFIKDG